jgi:hypothetical protein
MRLRKLLKPFSESATVYCAANVVHLEDGFIVKGKEVYMKPRFSYNYRGLKFA